MEEEFQPKSPRTATGCQDVNCVCMFVFLTSFFCVAMQKMYWYEMQLKVSGYLS